MVAKKWAGLTLAVLVVTGVVFAEAQQGDKSKDAQMRARLQRAATAGRSGDPAAREQRFRDEMAQQAEKHRAEVQQLADIKKLAEEENATKTAEAIQKLIDEKNAVYKKNLEQVERARRERAARLQQRAQQAKTQEPKKETDNAAKTAGETNKD